MTYKYRVSNTLDPEERLEDAALIEFNPFSLGNFGLYHCDPTAIAKAYHAIVEEIVDDTTFTR